MGKPCLHLIPHLIPQFAIPKNRLKVTILFFLAIFYCKMTGKGILSPIKRLSSGCHRRILLAQILDILLMLLLIITVRNFSCQELEPQCALPPIFLLASFSPQKLKWKCQSNCSSKQCLSTNSEIQMLEHFICSFKKKYYFVHKYGFYFCLSRKKNQ